MKKTAISLVVLFLACVAVFFIGWLPLRVPAGDNAVLVSKTGGIREAVISPGKFFWTPEPLLPTNVKIYSFKPLTLEQKIDMGGELPSAQAYRAFMAGEPDFSWKLGLRIAASVNPSALPGIVAEYGVLDDAMLANWLKDELGRASEDIRPLVMAAAADQEKVGALLSGALSAGFIESIRARRPALVVREISVLSVHVPDMALYESARLLYAKYLESYRSGVEPALVAASTKAAADQVRLDSLKRYGKLLEEYPSLIDLLAIEAGIPPRAQAGK